MTATRCCWAYEFVILVVGPALFFLFTVTHLIGCMVNCHTISFSLFLFLLFRASWSVWLCDFFSKAPHHHHHHRLHFQTAQANQKNEGAPFNEWKFHTKHLFIVLFMFFVLIFVGLFYCFVSFGMSLLYVRIALNFSLFFFWCKFVASSV